MQQKFVEAAHSETTTDVLEVKGVIDGVLTSERKSKNGTYTARVLPNGALEWAGASWIKDDPAYLSALSATSGA